MKGRCGANDPNIVAAVALLRETEPVDAVPTLSRIQVDDLSREGCDACVDSHKTIWVSPYSDAYRRAATGDPLDLARVLFHEQFHVRHGPDEAATMAATAEFTRRRRSLEAFAAALERG